MGKKSGRKGSKKKSTGDDPDFDSTIASDPRFASALHHPKFRKSSERAKDNAIELDERFSAVLTDERFSVPGVTKKKKKKNEKNTSFVNEELSEFYTIKKEHSEDDKSSDSENSSSSSESEKDDGPEIDDPEARIAYLNALSRGQISCSSDDESSDDERSIGSSSDSSHSGDESDENKRELDAIVGEGGIIASGDTIAPAIEVTNESSPYLAILNTSWEHVQAVDLLVLLSSFCPPGSIRQISVYPSDFGLERMKKDQLVGPQGIWRNGSDNNSRSEDDTVSNTDDEEKDTAVNVDSVVNSDYDPERLRAYEVMKLKYYFAIAEFNDAAVADNVYKEVDGMEMEHSSTALDLRSIPLSDIHDVIKDRKLRDRAISVPSNYEPPSFIVDALQQTDVKCTWEDGDYVREQKLTQYGVRSATWETLAENDDIKAYLGSDNSSEDDSSDDDKITKSSGMRKLLGLESGDEDSSGDDASSKSEDTNESESLNGDSDENEDGVEHTATFVPKRDLELKIRSKLKNSSSKEIGQWEKYLQKRKEKRKERRIAAKNKNRQAKEDDDSLYDDTEDVPEWARDEIGNEKGNEKDNFFSEEANERRESDNHNSDDDHAIASSKPTTQEELDLLLGGSEGKETQVLMSNSNFLINKSLQSQRL